MEKTTIKTVDDKLCDHLQKHADVYDPTIKKHDTALFGPDGRDGLSVSFAEIETKLNSIERIGYGIILVIITAAIALLTGT